MARGEEQRAAHAAPCVGGEQARVLAASSRFPEEAKEERYLVAAVNAGNGINLGRRALRADGKRRAERTLRPARATGEHGANPAHGIKRARALRLVKAEARALSS